MSRMEGDYLVHGLAADSQVRAVGARTTQMVEEARWRHDLWPVATAALGRAMTGAALLASSMKNEERLQVQLVGDGPLRHVTTTADAQGRVRGYVGNPHVHLPSTPQGKLDVGRAVGSGQLHVTKDLRLKEPYRSTLPLASGEVAEDLAHYLVVSEQTPSVMALGVLVETDNTVRASGGFMLQLMPGAGEDLVQRLEEKLARQAAVSRQIDEGRRPEDILEELFSDWGGVQWLERRDIRFSCSCSRENYERALIALGAGEVQDMIDTDGQAELICHFCRERYLFDEEDLQRILAAIQNRAH